MSVPDPVGRVHYNQPRAVQVREPENVAFVHSAVYGAFSVYTNTRLETDALLAAWAELAEVMDLKVQEILGRERLVAEE